MGLKEKLEERKERQEALKYFRSNNDAFMSIDRYVIIFLAVLLVSIITALVQAIFTIGTSISFGLFYLLGAYFIAVVTKKLATTINEYITIIAFIGFILMIIMSRMFTFAIPIYGVLNFYVPLFQSSWWALAITSIVSPDIFGWIMYIIAGYELFTLLK